MRKYHSRTQFKTGSLLLIAFLTLVTVSSGIAHAMLKNRQIQLSREIEKTRSSVQNLEYDISTENRRMQEALDRYEVRRSLEANQSQLRDIQMAQLENIFVPSTEAPALVSTQNR